MSEDEYQNKLAVQGIVKLPYTIREMNAYSVKLGEYFAKLRKESK